MRTSTSMAVLVGCVGFSWISEARADASSYPTAVVARDQTLPAGMPLVSLELGVGMSRGNAGKPVVLAPDLYYGVTRDLTLGIDHTRSLCLSGKSGGCAKAWDDLGVDGLYAIVRGGPVSVSAHGGVYALSADAGFVSARAGALLTIPLVAGKLNLYLDPQLGVGVTKRDRGNRESILAPVRFAYQATSAAAILVDTGVFGPLDGFGDHHRIPVGAGVSYGVSGALDVGARFTFDDLLGSDGSTRSRTLGAFTNIRF